MTQPLTKTVAAEVRAELARQEVTRTAAAARLGISRTLLWNRLRGDSPFTTDELDALADLLSVPVAKFMPQSAAAA